MRTSDRSVEHQVALIASRQHGVVTIDQLRGAGVSSQGVKRRFRKGTLHREYPGVYRVGHRAPSLEARYLAAVFACGEGAVLSGFAAAAVYGLIKAASPPPEVTTTADRRVNGVITHRARDLPRSEVTTHRRIPVTTVARTVVDIAARLSLDALAEACHEAAVKHRLRAPAVEAVLARRPNAPGARNLHEIFRGEARVTLSKLEKAFLALLRSANLPLPQTNRPASGRYVDCRWPEHNLTVELDSYTYHHTRHAWEQDRRRARQAHARGDDFRRYTRDDVKKDSQQVLVELRGLLSGAPGSGSRSGSPRPTPSAGSRAPGSRPRP